MASGLYSTFYAIGQILSPTIGGFLFDSYGYKTTCDIIATIIAIFTVIYFVTNVGFRVFAEDQKIKL